MNFAQTCSFFQSSYHCFILLTELAGNLNDYNNLHNIYNLYIFILLLYGILKLKKIISILIGL